MLGRQELAIVSCCNAEFCDKVASLFISILKNSYSSAFCFHFYVVEDDIGERNKRLLVESVQQCRRPAEIDFLSIDNQMFEEVIVSDRIPRTAYYRIYVPELFKDKNIDYLLYLDCDMIVLEDITTICQMSLDNMILAAVEDAGFHERLEKMNIPSATNCYFNSGFMYIDIKKWLAANITSKVLTFIKQNPEKLRFHDQDALNAVLHDRFKVLHPQWNVQSYIMNDEKVPPTKAGVKEYAEARQQPIVLHYSGHLKPWDEDFTGKSKQIYNYYFQQTAFYKEEIYQKICSVAQIQAQ